jgi:hypothetical protein
MPASLEGVVASRFDSSAGVLGGMICDWRALADSATLALWPQRRADRRQAKMHPLHCVRQARPPGLKLQWAMVRAPLWRSRNVAGSCPAAVSPSKRKVFGAPGTIRVLIAHHEPGQARQTACASQVTEHASGLTEFSDVMAWEKLQKNKNGPPDRRACRKLRPIPIIGQALAVTFVAEL